MSLSTLREVQQTNQETSSGCEVEVGPLRFKVWHKSPVYLCLLAGQDPSNLFEFREGETLTMRTITLARFFLPGTSKPQSAKSIEMREECSRVNFWLILKF